MAAVGRVRLRPELGAKNTVQVSHIRDAQMIAKTLFLSVSVRVLLRD